MNRQVVVLPAAEDDLDTGEEFYEGQAEGLGQHFIDTLRNDLRSLSVHSGNHRRLYGFHRALSKRFPYAIFYRVNGDLVSVYAVLDCRRDPEKTRRRLRGE